MTSSALSTPRKTNGEYDGLTLVARWLSAWASQGNWLPAGFLLQGLSFTIIEGSQQGEEYMLVPVFTRGSNSWSVTWPNAIRDRNPSLRLGKTEPLGFMMRYGSCSFLPGVDLRATCPSRRSR